MPETVPTYTAAQVRAAEKPLLDAGEPLMRRAAAALAGIVAEIMPPTGGRVLVLAGSGDNGGDALYAGAQLAELDDVEVDLFLTSDRAHVAALGAAVAAGCRKIDLPEVESEAAPHDIVLDGMLGIGVSADPALRGTARAVVEVLLDKISADALQVVAVDLPSGMHPDSGANDGTVLPASVTVTFGAVKDGLAHAPALVGSIVLVDIGLTLPPDAEGSASVTRRVDATQLSP